MKSMIYFVYALFLAGVGISGEQALAQQFEKHAMASLPQTQGFEEERIYQLRLPQGQVLSFSQSLIDQSERLKSAFSYGLTEYLVRGVITELVSEDPYKVSLQDLHDILALIAESKRNGNDLQQTLGKLLIADEPPAERMRELRAVAEYFDIPVLQELVGVGGGVQKETSIIFVNQNQTLSDFLAQHLEPFAKLLVNTDSYPARSAIKVAWSPDGKSLVIGNAKQQGQITLWDSAQKKWRHFPGKYFESIKCVVLSADGTHIASASYPHVVTGDVQGFLKIWDVATGQIVRTLPIEGKVDSIDWSRNGALLATIGSAGLKLWNTATWAVESEVAQVGHRGTAVAFSLDSKLLAMGNDHGDVSLWNIAKNGNFAQHRYSNQAVRAFSWSDTGQLAIVGDSAPPALWDVKKQEYKTLLGVSGDASVSSSADGKKVATSKEKTITLWDAPTKKVIYRMRETASKHDYFGIFGDVALAPSGDWLAFGYKKDKHEFVGIWDTSAALLQVPLSHVKLLERIIGAKKIILTKEEFAQYHLLPEVWKEMLTKAYGAPQAYESIWSKAKKSVQKIVTPSEKKVEAEGIPAEKPKAKTSFTFWKKSASVDVAPPSYDSLFPSEDERKVALAQAVQQAQYADAPEEEPGSPEFVSVTPASAPPPAEFQFPTPASAPQANLLGE